MEYIGDKNREIKNIKTPLRALAPVSIPAQRASDANKDEEHFLSEKSKIPKLDKVKYYTSLILGFLCVVNVFIFLFLIPFVIDPAISTMSYR